MATSKVMEADKFLDLQPLPRFLVFYDFETTCLIERIPTELSMIAISTSNFIKSIAMHAKLYIFHNFHGAAKEYLFFL